MPVTPAPTPSVPSTAETDIPPSASWHVEFIGLPGSGKTMLANRLVHMLRSETLGAMNFDQALNRVLIRAVRQNKGWKAACKAVLFHTTIQRFWRGVFWPHDQIMAGCIFGTDHPDLLASLARVLAASGQHLEERDRIFRYLFREYSGFQLFSTHRQEREMLVWDEGFCHRALSLWGRWPGKDLADEIQFYVAAIPPPSYVFHVTTDPLLSIERMQHRGFAPFVNHFDHNEIIRKMERLQTIADLICAALSRLGVPVIQTANSGVPAEADAVLKDAAKRLASDMIT